MERPRLSANTAVMRPGPPAAVTSTSAQVAVAQTIARYVEREPVVRAFTWFDVDRARRLAAEPHDGPLAGIPVGVKDIIDTAGIPTCYGSRLYASRVPERDALVVTRLRAAGAIDVGKTVTTEFAFYAPGPTTNPHDASRTPGGSSMGSAAAVAAGIVPLAVGTQTNGSIIRPAAFCGVVGLKPSLGLVPRDGVMRFSATLDVVGGFARTVAEAAVLVAVMAGEPVRDWRRAASSVSPPRVAVIRTSDWRSASAAMRARFSADVDALRWAGAIVERAQLPAGIDVLAPELHSIVMRYEGARAIGAAALRRRESITPASLAFFEEGARIGDDWYREALEQRARLVDTFARWAARYDAILTPPTVGEAPTLETTGDPRFCTRWSLLGVPAITIPTGTGPSGLPLGLQLVGGPGADERTIAAAAWAERILTQQTRPATSSRDHV